MKIIFCLWLLCLVWLVAADDFDDAMKSYKNDDDMDEAEWQSLVKSEETKSDDDGATSSHVFIVDRSIRSKSADGSLTKPFNNIQDCVNELKTTGQPGDECQIRKGRYHENITIDGLIGTKEKPYVIKGYENERPILDGTIIINKPVMRSKWRLLRKGSKIYRTKINQDIWQLFVDGQMMTNARWPNSKWSDYSIFNGRLWSKLDGKSKKGLIVNKGDSLADSKINMTGAMAILNIGSFNTFVAKVEKHSAGENEFSYKDTFGPYRFKPSISRYYFEDKLELLDSPEEWYYNKATKELFVWLPSERSPNRHELRGKVQTYAMKITNTKHLVLKNLDFFATTISATSSKWNNIDDIRFDSLKFNYPTYSKRMLGDISLILRTKVLGKSKKEYGSFVFFNNTFYGSDGTFLDVDGREVRYENNLIEYNDWTGANQIYMSGGFGPIKSVGQREYYIRNTVRYNGASTGLQPGWRPFFHLNHLIGQCWGILQNDGSALQMQIRQQNGANVSYNWAHSTPKYGLRFDGQPPRVGRNGTLTHNVVFKSNGLMVKGNDHLVKNNLAFHKYNKDDDDEQGEGCSLCVLRFVRENPVEINNNTVVINNIADVANGGKDLVLHKGEIFPLAGRIVENNIPNATISSEIIDAYNLDFRPMPESEAALKGIGPYPYNPDMRKYWIPGRQLYKASTPVPPNGSNTVIAERRDALMFLQAYNCSKHHIFFGEDEEKVREDELGEKAAYMATLDDGDNLYYLSKKLEVGKRYFWRVDAEMTNGDIYKGDVWSFSTR